MSVRQRPHKRGNIKKGVGDMTCQCGKKLWDMRTVDRNYCPHCGKKVDWPEDQEIIDLGESEFFATEK